MAPRQRPAVTPITGFRPTDWSDVSTALVDALSGLAASTDAMTIAVERHDLDGLLVATDRAEVLIRKVNEISAGLTEADRPWLDASGILALRDRLDVAGRRNAHLIERAWALDAATMRLLASLGRPAPDVPLHSYAPPSAPAYLDWQA